MRTIVPEAVAEETVILFHCLRSIYPPSGNDLVVENYGKEFDGLVPR